MAYGRHISSYVALVLAAPSTCRTQPYQSSWKKKTWLPETVRSLRVLLLQYLTLCLALLQFAFQLGGAVSLCISQTIFLGRLTVDVKSSLPDSPGEVLNSNGADKLAYQRAIWDVLVFLLVTSGLALLASFGFEHKNVKKMEEAQKTGRARRVQED
jgi:hypothetical protein